MISSKLNLPFVTTRVLVVALLCLFCHPAASQKTDTLFLKNGDRMIGELKYLRYGILNYSTSSMGTVKIEWIDVDKIFSTKEFVVKTDEGESLRGRFDSTAVVNDLT